MKDDEKVINELKTEISDAETKLTTLIKNLPNEIKESFNDELNNEVKLNNNYRISDYFFFRLSSKYDTILQNFKEIRISTVLKITIFALLLM